jgi:hypothetical protein
MKRFIATAAVCGVSLFGFTAVAGAAGNPPNPNPAALDHPGVPTACTAVTTHNPTAGGTANGNFPTLNLPYQFDSGQVGQVFCGL